MLATEVDWHNPFSTEFSFLEAIERPECLGKSITDDISKIYRQLSPADFLDNDRRLLGYLGVKWSLICDDATACLKVDSSLEPYLKRLADVC